MIQINQLKIPVSAGESAIRQKIIKELNLRYIFKDKDIPSFSYKIVRKSIDARKKPDIFYIYTVAVSFDGKQEDYIIKKCKCKNASFYNPVIYEPKINIKHNCLKRPIIVGEGPAGLFAGLILSRAGLNPIIIERGDNVDNRVEKVENFWLNGSIDEETNVQFGEGGAGTFSDGKLNTLVKDKTGKNQFVLDTFVLHGADSACAYDAKPHVGTDVLKNVVSSIRNEIIQNGGSVVNLCKLTDLVVKNDRIDSIIVNNTSSEKEIIETDDLILAIGHSARDTFRMLYDRGLNIEQKNFALGIRIQHPQKMINESQYGQGYNEDLPPSPYKVTNHTSNGRDVFSFCMCPGGYVVNASSINGHTCVNGMSYSDRGSENANSALIVAVDRKDFGSEDPLAGVMLQERLEKEAFELSNGCIPVQLFKDYCENRESEGFLSVKPMFKGKTAFSNLRKLFPEEINEALIESINKFSYTIEGFNDDDAILAAVESRTSSPIRILRDEKLESNIKGIYPCGEGAGYAGGIMSAAMDGIKVAEAIINKYIL